MSNNNKKTNKSSKPKEKDLKSNLKQKQKRSDNYHAVESKTPPLPKKISSTLEELLQKRKSLKQELKHIVKYSDNDFNKYNRKRGHSKEDYHADKVRVKKRLKENENKSNTYSKKPRGHSSSPELDNTHFESEDEETIIQQRRQKRKQLLASFNVHVRTINETEEMIHNTIAEDKATQKIKKNNNNIKVTDMFSEKDDFESKVVPKSSKSDEINLNLVDNWDDAEGYYNIQVGDVLNNKYTIKGILGQGVFANVAKAKNINDENEYVAIKIIRNNELMYRTSIKEIAILKEIRQADPENKCHCVNLLGHFMHKGHLCLVLESLHMDLRNIIKKYGKHGLNMKALVSYSRQLFLALRLIKKLGIIHADIKPDNILVNENKNLLKLCDFGSAAKIDESEPTPYLVSRFYRAPEIILGMDYNHGVDIWSAACTVYEMATGRILFTGGSNNKMLKCFMDLKGRFSSRLLKKGKFKDQHFNYNNNFLLHKVDEHTGREKVVEISNITQTKDLLHELRKAYKTISVTEEKKVMQLRDLLDKMTMLDSNQRLTVIDCLRHAFVYDEYELKGLK